MTTFRFATTLKPYGEGGAYPGLFLARSVSAKLGRARVPVVLTLNGHLARTSAFPLGDGTHYIHINRQMREAARVAPGDRVRVTLEVDTKPRVVIAPADLRGALARSAKARAVFDGLAPSHKREYVRWIAEAKRPETRARRVAQTVERLAQGAKEPR